VSTMWEPLFLRDRSFLTRDHFQASVKERRVRAVACWEEWADPRADLVAGEGRLAVAWVVAEDSSVRRIHPVNLVEAVMGALPALFRESPASCPRCRNRALAMN
jgi:hypothetical protein